MTTENTIVGGPTLLDRFDCRHNIADQCKRIAEAAACPICQAQTIQSLRAALAVEVAEKNKFEKRAEKLDAMLKGLRLPPEVLKTN